jgi:hypothetical protein
MPLKTRPEFIQAYKDHAAEFGAVVDDDEVKRMADRAERPGSPMMRLRSGRHLVTKSGRLQVGRARQ